MVEAGGRKMTQNKCTLAAVETSPRSPLLARDVVACLAAFGATGHWILLNQTLIMTGNFAISPCTVV